MHATTAGKYRGVTSTTRDLEVLTFEAMDLFRIEDGRTPEHWDVIQGRGLLSTVLLIVSG